MISAYPWADEMHVKIARELRQKGCTSCQPEIKVKRINGEDLIEVICTCNPQEDGLEETI